MPYFDATLILVTLATILMLWFTMFAGEKLLFVGSLVSDLDPESFFHYHEIDELGWCVLKYNIERETQTEDAIVIVGGLGGNREFLLPLSQQLSIVYPNRDIIISDHPGYGTLKKRSASLDDCRRQIVQMNHFVKSKYRNIIWVGHCFGGVLIAKCVEENELLFQQGRDAVILINSFVDPFIYGIHPVPLVIYSHILRTIVPVKKKELVCAYIGFQILRDKGILKGAIHSSLNHHVPVSHGRMLQKILGEDYLEFPKGRHNTIDVENNQLVSFLRRLVRHPSNLHTDKE